MNDGLAALMRLIQQGFEWIGKTLTLIWSWSFGQIIRALQLPFSTLPWWKQIVYVAVIGAVAYVLYHMARQLLDGVLKVFRSILELLKLLIDNIPQVLVAGVIALIGSWIITNVNFNTIVLKWPW